MENLTNIDRLKLPDLIGRLSQVENGSRHWQLLWTNFDKRVSAYLWAICRNNSEITENFSDTDIKDLISVSKQKIYANFRKLEFPEGSTTRDLELRIKGWMGKVLRHQAADTIKKAEILKEFFIKSDETLLESLTIPETEEEILSPRSSLMLQEIQEALQYLSSRDREIFETYAINRHHNGRIDDYLLRGLEKKYNLPPGYSSKIYARSIEKIKKTINKHQNGKASQKDTGDDEVSG